MTRVQSPACRASLARANRAYAEAATTTGQAALGERPGHVPTFLASTQHSVVTSPGVLNGLSKCKSWPGTVGPARLGTAARGTPNRRSATRAVGADWSCFY